MRELAAPARAFVHRIDAATPAHRDRAVDALRALAICGVVLGHWCVTALVPGEDGVLHTASPLRAMPWLTPVSWLFQTLAVFFLVGGHMAAKGYVSARARGETYGRWLGSRLGRLFRPVVAVLGVWTAAALGMLLSGVPLDTVHTLGKLALSPMWFLLVFAALTAATPVVARIHPLWPLAVVLHVDLVRFGLGGPAWTGWINLAAGWLVPYTLGTAWARGVPSRRTAVLLLVGGAVATAGLVRVAGYPAAMVGVPGAPVSNLNPPTLAAVTFGLAQCGLALLLLDRLRALLRRPVLWAVVAAANLVAMTVFLWHQTALMAVTATGLLAGRLPGLHTAPETVGWVRARVGWIPVFGLALTVCGAAFAARERHAPGPLGAPVPVPGPTRPPAIPSRADGSPARGGGTSAAGGAGAGPAGGAESCA
ncbi:acyltransferase [Streptomyces sp. SID5785]|uniref:acyltransferase family protein n=1 Tax=Streptomyces sp. SID5785 TaxID=2690309 RepID=UPI0031B9D846